MAGRFRRLILRPFAWGLTLAVLAGLGIVLLVRSQFLQDRARTLIEVRVAEVIGRPLSIGRVRLGFSPLSLEAWDVVLAGPRPEDPPAATVERLRIEADWFGWRRPVIAVRTVWVEKPRVLFTYDETGRDNWPRLKRRAAPTPPSSSPIAPLPPVAAVTPRRFSVRIEHLRVEQGEFRLDDGRWPVEIDARGVEGTALGVEDLRLRGRASVDDILVALPNGKPVRASLASEIELARGEVLLSAISVRAPHLEVGGDGTIHWGRTRSVDLQLAATGSTALLEEMGYLDAEDPPVRGSFDLDGSFSWRPQGWGYRGILRAPELTVIDRRFEDVSGPFSGNREGVRVDFERASHHGGSVTGFFTLDQRTKDYPAEVQLEFRAAEAAGLLADQAIPVTDVAATADGSFGYRFSFRDGAKGDGELRARLTAHPPDAEVAGSRRLPISGDVGVDLADGHVRVLPATLVAERGGGATTLTVAGDFEIPRQSGEFQIGIVTERLGDLAPFLPPPEPGEPAQLWIPTRGRGRLDVELGLAPAGPSARVDFALEDVVTPGLSARSARGHLRIDERWVDELELEASGALLAGVPGTGMSGIGDHGGEVRLRGRIPLRETPASPLAGAMDLSVDAEAWPIADVRPWLPEELLDVPVDGRFDGQLVLRGDPEAPSGEVRGRLEEAAWSGLVLGTFAFELGVSPEAVELRQARLEMPAGVISASGSIDLRPDPALLELRFSGPLRLDDPPFALANRDRDEGLSGEAVLEGRVSGSSERPAVEAVAELSGLALAGRPVVGSEAPGRGTIRATWRELLFDVHGEVPGLVELTGGGPLVWKGEGDAEHLEADWTLAARLGDLGAVTALVAPQIEGVRGRLAGQLRARGPLDDLTLGVEIADLAALYQGHALVANEPIRASFDGRVLDLGSFYLGEPNTDNEVFVAGRVDLGAEGGSSALDLRLQATVSADWARPFLPATEIAGVIDALGAVRGTLGEPVVSGQATLQQGRLLLTDFPQVLEDVEVTLLADAREVVIDEASLRTGGGSIRGSGSITLPRSGSLAAEAQDLGYRVQVQARDVTMRYPEGFWLRGGGELSLVSVTGGRQVRGFLELDQIAYVKDIDLSVPQLMRSFLSKQRVEVREVDEFLSTTQLNVAIQAPGTFRVSNNLARLRGTADLTLRGSLASPVLFGRLEVEPGGTLVYGENDYTIEQARVTFVNPFRIEPLIDIKARTRINPYEVTLSLVGTPERLDARFTSDPPIPDIDILTLIATGGTGATGLDGGTFNPAAQPTTALPGESSTFGAESFLAGQAANYVGQRVNQLFRFDRFRVAPLVGSEQNISSVRLTVGKRLSRDVYVTYSVDPAQSRDQLLSVEWRVASNLALVFTQNGSGSYAVDARWETAF